MKIDFVARWTISHTQARL